MKHILVVDDEIGTRESLKAIFWGTHQVLTASSAAEACEILKQNQVDLILLDILMPEKDGIEFLKEIRIPYPDLPVIMVSATTSTNTLAEAIRLGAVDFISKPFDIADIRTIAERAINQASMRRQIEANRREAILEYPLHNIVGESPAFRSVMHQARSLATEDHSLLILGERGAGNELMARYIHSLSTRNKQPFISLQCSSLPEAMVETELFGKDQSNGTKSEIETMGRIELANSGFLLLKDVHALSKAIQEKLLRVIREKVFERVNGSYSIKTNVRLIFTSSNHVELHGSPTDMIPELFEQIKERVVQLPPLRKRKEDIPLLSYCFLNYFKQKMNTEMSDIDTAAMGLLRKYWWPGNVKELRNVIERVVVVHGDLKSLRAELLPFEIQKGLNQGKLNVPFVGTLEETVNAFQRELITKALAQTKGKQVKAARLLGTTTRILNYRIKQLNIKAKY